jgi:hypothetical protein
MISDNQNFSQNNNESGSAILWVLMAVALFAALNFAFNSSSRVSTSVLDDAAATAYANQIIAYGNEVKSAVKRMKLRGCSDTEISFANQMNKSKDGSVILVPDGHNPNTPTDGSCEIYKSTGGNLNAWLLSDNHTYDWSGLCATCSSRNSYYPRRIQIPGVGLTNKEDITLMGGLIKKEVCLKINNTLNVNNPSNSPPKATITGTAIPNGSFSDNNSLVVTDIDGEITGKSSFCGGDVAENPQGYIYYHVLLTR